MYDDGTDEFTMTTLEPFTPKPYSEMRPEDWRATRVKFQTSQLPPIDNVTMSKSTSNMVYYSYVRAAH